MYKNTYSTKFSFFYEYNKILQQIFYIKCVGKNVNEF